jgi:hypothetical protein
LTNGRWMDPQAQMNADAIDEENDRLDAERSEAADYEHEMCDTPEMACHLCLAKYWPDYEPEYVPEQRAYIWLIEALTVAPSWFDVLDTNCDDIVAELANTIKEMARNE